MRTKTFKIIYAGVLLFIGIVVLGMVFVSMYGQPIYDRQLNALRTESLFIPTGQFNGLAECLELIIGPTVVYVIFVFVAGCGIFWFKEEGDIKKILVGK